MRLDELPTPCLVLDRIVLEKNLEAMRAVAQRHGVSLRPHLKTAKSVKIARLAFGDETGPITVSTLAEAEYFGGQGFGDITLAAGITPQKLGRAAALVETGVSLSVLTDDVAVAKSIGSHISGLRALIEIDSGEGRGGVAADSDALLEIGRALGKRLAGVLTHGGHSYACRTADCAADVAEQERRTVTRAADVLREAGLSCEMVSIGSTPSVTHARALDGVTEVRPGVYMFGDLFQAEIGSCTREDIALTVLASVIGRRESENRILIDAGSLALSKDRSTAATDHDAGFGIVWGIDCEPVYGECRIERAYQEHGVATGDTSLPFEKIPVGTKVRVAPNHACLTAAAYDRYYVVEGGDEVVAIWDRINGW
ncbi:MAG: alanine racemase [Gemmatimonadaceae bacterium]